MRHLGGERVDRTGARLLFLEHRGDRQAAKTAKGVADKFAARPGRPGVGKAGLKGHKGTHSG